jgi:hypothetical protein
MAAMLVFLAASAGTKGISFRFQVSTALVCRGKLVGIAASKDDSAQFLRAIFKWSFAFDLMKCAPKRLLFRQLEFSLFH